jgi:hypothetical protein
MDTAKKLTGTKAVEQSLAAFRVAWTAWCGAGCGEEIGDRFSGPRSVRMRF